MSTLSVPFEPASAAVVRGKLAADLNQAGLPRGLIADALLVATELVANAVRHGSAQPNTSIDVSWETGNDAVTVRVTDAGGSSRPTVQHPGPDQISGRGLSIVAALATGWGVDDQRGATTVWATLRS